ncbi:MAG: hypothetical protein AAFX85_18675, partial [Pseudomonadota bacterium]
MRTYHGLTLPAALALLLSQGATAGLLTVDFEGDGLGHKTNGFSAVGVDGVSFSDTLGNDLRVGRWAECNYTNCLAVFADDESALRIDLDFIASGISLDFGNDQAFGSRPVADAELMLYRDGAYVGTSTVAVNGNDRMDQTISFSGAFFDQALFRYTDVVGFAATLIEVV